MILHYMNLDSGNLDDRQDYLEHTRYLDFNRKIVDDTTRRLLKSILPADHRKKAVRLFYFVRDEIPYDLIETLFTRRDLKASTVLKRRKGFCVQKAVLLTAMARAARIPARLHFADIRNHRTSGRALELMHTDLFVWHGYTEMNLDGQWVKVNPAFNKTLCEKKDLPTVEFDGTHDAVFADMDLNGDPFVEYVKDHGTYADVPYKKILNGWFEEYAEYWALK